MKYSTVVTILAMLVVVSALPLAGVAQSSGSKTTKYQVLFVENPHNIVATELLGKWEFSSDETDVLANTAKKSGSLRLKRVSGEYEFVASDEVEGKVADCLQAWLAVWADREVEEDREYHDTLKAACEQVFLTGTFREKSTWSANGVNQPEQAREGIFALMEMNGVPFLYLNDKKVKNGKEVSTDEFFTVMVFPQVAGDNDSLAMQVYFHDPEMRQDFKVFKRISAE
jgi:hypothetical protein